MTVKSLLAYILTLFIGGAIGGLGVHHIEKEANQACEQALLKAQHAKEALLAKKEAFLHAHEKGTEVLEAVKHWNNKELAEKVKAYLHHAKGKQRQELEKALTDIGNLDNQNKLMSFLVKHMRSQPAQASDTTMEEN